ncbi:MAG: hypothetical protein V2A74_14470, partial [bacterium]
MIQRKQAFVLLSALTWALALEGLMGVQAQTVTVDGVGANPPANFATLGEAVKSFRTGSGANAGNAEPNVIQVDAWALSGGFLDEAVGFVDFSFTTPLEPMLVEGINGTPNLRCQDSETTANLANDALEIWTDANITIRNFVISPSLNGPTLVGDLIQIFGQDSGGPVSKATTITFEDCVITSRDNEGNPVCPNRESAFVNTVAKIARDIPGGDLINFGSGRDQVVRLVLRNCVLSHCRATG